MSVSSLRESSESLWEAAVARLDADLRSQIDFGRDDKIEVLSDVLLAANDAQKQCDAKAWKLRRKDGATVSVRDVFAKISTWVGRFKDIGDIVVQVDPIHAALPWAGVRFLLKIATSDFEKYNFLLETIPSITEVVCNCACMEGLLVQFSHSGSSPPPPAQELRRALINLYVCVLTFLAKSHKYFHQSVANELNRYCELTDMLSTFKAPMARWSDGLAKITDKLDRSERRRILSWLSGDPYPKHHTLVRNDIIEGTGQWLLSSSEYTQWKEESASSILWLHGIPGSGKSKLVSVVIEDALAAFQQQRQPPPAYFYCSRNPAEPNRCDPKSILASIARQMSCLKPGEPILHETEELYETCQDEFFDGSLQLRDIVQLILKLAPHYPTITIVVDALDECNPETRGQLLSSLEKILKEASCLVKIFVSSRDDQDIIYRLRNYPGMELSSDKNAGDISRFVESETTRLVEEGSILRYSILQDQLRGGDHQSCCILCRWNVSLGESPAASLV